MKESRIIAVVSPKYSVKDESVSFPVVKLDVPVNVKDINYFQYAVQYHFCELGFKYLDSEIIKLETKKIDTNDEKAVKKYHDNLDHAKTAKNLYMEYTEKFKKDIETSLTNAGFSAAEIDELENEFSSDTFARTYSAVKMKFYTHTEYGDTQEDGTKKSKKVNNTDIFIMKDSTGVCRLKSNVIDLEEILSRDNAKKDEKKKAYNPLIQHLQNVLFPIDSDNIRYDHCNFHNMSMRYFQAFLSSIREDAEKNLAVKHPFQIVKNLAFVGLAWLKSENIEDLEKEIEINASGIQKRQEKA